MQLELQKYKKAVSYLTFNLACKFKFPLPSMNRTTLCQGNLNKENVQVSQKTGKTPKA